MTEIVKSAPSLEVTAGRLIGANMKLEWKKLTTTVDNISMVSHYLNTPTGVILTGGQSGGHFTVDDCNVTDEGEFVPAPGLEKLAFDVVMSDAAETLTRVAIYVDDVLSSPQASATSKAVASAVVSILRGER